MNTEDIPIETTIEIGNLDEIVNTTTKKRGRPRGTHNQPKEPAEKPYSSFKNFKVLRYWQDYIYIVFLGSDTKEYKIREAAWITATIKFGYKANTLNSWKFFPTRNGFAVLDFK